MNIPKILVIGKNGQIGWELERSLCVLGDVVAVDRQSIDLANADSILTSVRKVQPDVIVNAAAYTAVDKAESEPELAMTINGNAPGILAEEAKRLGALLIHYSTDYVFDGTKRTPYTEDDAPNPINVYGKTKLAGERAVQAVGGNYMILRTSWVYGLRGNNFLLTILRLLREKAELRIVDDQIGSPTWCRTISDATAHIVAFALRNPGQLEAGLCHLTAGGQTSWCGFARAVAELAVARGQGQKTILPIASKEYPTPAKRPLYSVLANEKRDSFLLSGPDWRRTLGLAFKTALEREAI